MSNYICCECGKQLTSDTVCEFDGQYYCNKCLESLTVVCADCGDRLFREDNAGNASIPLCASCRDAEYTICCRCGRLIHNDDVFYLNERDEDPYCESCMELLNECPIHNYHYKPQAIFYGDGPRYFGVELEIDDAGETDRHAQAILDVANGSAPHIYCKHDGSLDDGFEIVTHPMTLEYHMDGMPWEAVVEKARALGYCSHQAGTCGLHVHVNTDSLGETTEEREEAIARILYFMERHWNELLQFSRRTRRQLERWAARYGYKDHPTEMMEHVKKGSCNRYTCVNLLNPDTVEFRIFRGTLKYNTLIATIQLVNRICNLAVYLSDDEIRHTTWSQFVGSVTEAELIQYLKERRLYISDPVISEEEI